MIRETARSVPDSPADPRGPGDQKGTSTLNVNSRVLS